MRFALDIQLTCKVMKIAKHNHNYAFVLKSLK